MRSGSAAIGSTYASVSTPPPGRESSPLSSATGPWLIHDLACGAGSMGRWLAPLLPGQQHWVLHDCDADLLAVAALDVPRAARDGAPIRVETRLSDVTKLGQHDLAGATLITASALLDLLTAAELASVVRACARAACPVLFTLSVTGRAAPRPAGSARRTCRQGVCLTPAPPDLTRPPARPGRCRRRGRGLPQDRGRGRRCREPVAARRCRGGPGRRVVHRVDRRGVRGRARADCRRRPVPTPAFARGAGRQARRHRRTRRSVGAAMRNVPWWVRSTVAALVLAAVVWSLGTGPFLDGVRAVDGRALAVAAGIGLVCTVCCAWRWTVVARGLGVPLSLRDRSRRVLPIGVPESHASGRRRRRRPSWRQPRARGGRRRPRAARGRLGAHRRAGRAGRAHRRRAARAAVAGSLVHAVRRALRSPPLRSP